MSEYTYEHVQSGADHMGRPVEQPTLVQREEIVRCRDCEYNAKDTDGICYRFDHEHFNQPDGFCAWAVKRTGAEKNGSIASGRRMAMAYPIEAPFGGDTYALLSCCAGCRKRYDGNDSEWTVTMTTEGNMACWLLWCMDCKRKLDAKEGGE